MKQSVRLLVLIAFSLLAFAWRSPAPLVYQPGEGWTYDTPGTENGKWQRARAKDQMDVAQAAYDKKDYALALKAALRVEKQWPLSDYAPRAQYLVGRCYEATGNDERAFNAYQRIIDKNPKAENYQEILGRQYDIANRYLNGQWFKLWNYIPFFPSMDKTAGMYEKIIRSGPYSDVAAQAQLKLGEAREKQAEPEQAIKAYEAAADRYNDRPKIAADALYKSGMAYRHQFKSPDYDKNIPVQSIAALTDFITLYPQDPRVPEAQKAIGELKTAAAQGSFSIARYYEERQKWNGALVYYNEVLVQEPNSPLGQTARQKIEMLKKKLGVETAAPAPAAVPATAAQAAPSPEAKETSAPASKPAETKTETKSQETKSRWWNPMNWLPAGPHPGTNSVPTSEEPKK